MNIGDIFDGYNLIESLGDGSYGDVYLSEKDGEKFALKFLRNKNDAAGFDKSKFDSEKNSWIKVSGHRNIIKIHRADIKNARYFIVMDYADGGSLQRKKFPRNEAVQIMLEILGGVNHLHNLNIIHRDIKPANILLKTNIPCLGDFGLARDLDLTLSSTQIAGTFGYLSPEIVNADQTYQRHPSNDLWATAVTFYEILTGTRPFEGSILNLVSFNQKPYPADFPADLIEFFNKAFQKERENRFQSASEMITTLQEIEQKRVEQELSQEIRKQLETEYHQKYQDAIKKNDDEINLLRKMNKTLEEQAQKERDNFQNKIKTRDAELTDLKDTILALSSHHKIEEEKQNLTNKFEKKISSLEEKLQNLKDNNYKLESQAKIGGEELFNAKNIIKGLEAGMTEKKKELSGLVDNNAELKSQILNKNKEIEEFTQSYKQEKEQLQKSKKVIKELEININKKEKEFSDLKVTNTRLSSQITLNNHDIEKHKQLYSQENKKYLALKANQPSKFFSRFGGLSLLSLILAGFYWGYSLLPDNRDYDQIAQDCLNKKDYQCAINYYPKAIEKNPTNAINYIKLGDIYRYLLDEKDQDQNKAIELYTKVINEIDNNNSDAFFALGYSNNKLKNYDKAIEYYEKFCKGFKECFANLNIGHIYQYGIKDFDKAKEYYENISATDFVKPERLSLFYSDEDSKNKYKNKSKAEENYNIFLTKEKQYRDSGKDFEKTKKNLRDAIDKMKTEAGVNSNTNTNSFKPMNFNLLTANVNRKFNLNNSNSNYSK